MFLIKTGFVLNIEAGTVMNTSVLFCVEWCFAFLLVRNIINTHTKVIITNESVGIKYFALSNLLNVSPCPSEENNIFSTKKVAMDLKLESKRKIKATIAKITMVFLEGGLKLVCVRTLLAMRIC